MPMLAPATDARETVVLKGGLSVPLAALRVLWDLEGRGFDLRVTTEDARDVLVVSPTARITSDDDHAIRQHRDALLALVAYCKGPIQ